MCEEHVCDKCLVITRKMTSDQNVKVPDIKYSLRKPEHSEQTIIDVTIKNDPLHPQYKMNHQYNQKFLL